MIRRPIRRRINNGKGLGKRRMRRFSQRRRKFRSALCWPVRLRAPYQRFRFFAHCIRLPLGVAWVIDELQTGMRVAIGTTLEAARYNAWWTIWRNTNDANAFARHVQKQLRRYGRANAWRGPTR